MNWNDYVKIETYCPTDFVDKIRFAIGDAGGGVLGNYQNCIFLSDGVGYFLPMNGSNPAIGKIGEIEKVKETKIEFVCEKTKVKAVIAAIKKTHPYEKVWIGITQLIDCEQ